jgi:hypothetical protein
MTRIKRTITTLAVASSVGGLALMPAGAANAAGTGAPPNPCSPDGVFVPDRDGSIAGVCKYPKKKCWWTCPRKTSAGAAVATSPRGLR